MSPRLSPELRNVIQLGVGFLFVFFAFNSQGFIEETVIESFADDGSINKHAGYYSLSIIYATFTLANFIAAPVVEILGARWAMLAGSLCYTLFQAGFLFLNSPFLYASSALLGVGAAILWTGQGKYLATNSTDATSSRNAGLLWAISQTCLSSGGVFLFIVFHSQDDKKISHSTVRILYGVFTAVSLLGNFVLAMLTMPQKATGEDAAPKVSHRQLLASTFRLLFTRQMFLLAFVFSYTGIELAFWSGIYPTSVSFTEQLGSNGLNTNSLLALNAIAAGIGQICGGGLFGMLGSRTGKFGRNPIVALGAATHLICFLIVYINLPADAPLKKTSEKGLIDPSITLALLSGGLLGFGDACWNTQIYSLLVTEYRKESAQAFALLKFFQSLLSCAAFFYGSALQMQWHLLILLISGVIALLCFFVVESRVRALAIARRAPSNHRLAEQEKETVDKDRVIE